MKIATVTPYDFAMPGGVNTHVFQMADWLRAAGHEVQVIGPSARPETAPPGTTVVGRARGLRAGGSVARIALSWRMGSAVEALLARERFDVVHVHEPLMPLLPLHFLRHSDAVNVGTFHAAEPLGRTLYRLAGPVLRRWLERLHARIAVSRTAEALASGLGGRCEIIPNCVDVERFATPVPPPPALADGRPTLLFVGRQERRKGLGVLLRAYAQVRQARPDVRLVVVGPMSPLGEQQRAWVQRQGWDDVCFTGAVPEEALPAYYQAADVFCAPATGGESFGMVLTEAMAAGTPVVASDIAGYRHVVRDGIDGLLAPPSRPDALAAALLTLLESAPRRRALAARGRERADTFHLDRVGRSVLDLYDRSLARRAISVA